MANDTFREEFVRSLVEQAVGFGMSLWIAEQAAEEIRAHARPDLHNCAGFRRLVSFVVDKQVGGTEALRAELASILAACDRLSERCAFEKTDPERTESERRYWMQHKRLLERATEIEVALGL